MQETKDNSLFTELTAEESASVNGGHYYSDRYYSSRYGCRRRRPRRVVYRRNCDGYYTTSYRYYD